ncbi:MAG: hypothetical protein MZV49_27515 [Rhodopseudomonas palustris]|nr:hypothetical protein [Rhodopseudomonas palustris]
MNDNSKRLLFGGLLVLAGAVFILQQLFNWPIGGVFISLLLQPVHLSSSLYSCVTTQNGGH